jgi:hypothetical protein
MGKGGDCATKQARCMTLAPLLVGVFAAGMRGWLQQQPGLRLVAEKPSAPLVLLLHRQCGIQGAPTKSAKDYERVR